MTKRYKEPPKQFIKPDKLYIASIETGKGTVTVHLFARLCPVLVNNFAFLAKERFYDGNKIHRVIAGVLVQSGDPVGIGTIGAGYRLPDEANALKVHHERGVLAMANAGLNSNSSQWFITLDDMPEFDGRYCVIGLVEKGMEVVDSWVVGDIIKTIRVEEVG